MSFNPISIGNDKVKQRIDFSSPTHVYPIENEDTSKYSSLISKHIDPEDHLFPIPNKIAILVPVVDTKEKVSSRKYCKNYWLGLSYIPVLGTIPSITCQCVLAGKLKKATDSAHLIPLLKKMNQFKIASMVRSLLTLAAVISFLAFAILTGGITLGLGIGLALAASIFGGGLTAFHGIQLHTNKSEIKALMSQPPPEFPSK